MVRIRELFDEKISLLRRCLPIGAKQEEIMARGLSIPATVHKDRLLFLGLNPAFSEKRDSTHPLVEYYQQPSDQSHPYKPYYGAIINMATKVSMNWTHWDLVFVRETKQEFVKTFAEEFIKKQLAISMEVLKQANPKIIVVNNAHASGLITTSSNVSIKFDSSIGTHRIKLQANTPGTPIFFCSMLSGQRAMDNGSKERLAWHIKFVKERLKID